MPREGGREKPRDLQWYAMHLHVHHLTVWKSVIYKMKIEIRFNRWYRSWNTQIRHICIIIETRVPHVPHWLILHKLDYIFVVFFFLLFCLAFVGLSPSSASHLSFRLPLTNLEQFAIGVSQLQMINDMKRIGNKRSAILFTGRLIWSVQSHINKTAHLIYQWYCGLVCVHKILSNIICHMIEKMLEFRLVRNVSTQ